MASVLFVCTANRIRSPLAEAALRRAVGPLPVRVESAGTMAATARPVKEALVAASRLGLDLSEHSARTILDLDMKIYDLILGFELAHVAALVVDSAAPPEKVFTLPEAVRLISNPSVAGHQDPASRLRSAVAEAHRSRQENPRFHITDQIDDPIGRGQATVDRCAKTINTLCLELAHRMWLTIPNRTDR